MSVRVTLVSNFGPEVRGVSPYTDFLFAGLRGIADLSVDRVDFEQAYPARLVPSATAAHHEPGPDDAPRVLHWARPGSWRGAVANAGEIVHLQYWTIFTAYYLLAVLRHAHKSGRKVVITVHNPDPHERLPLLDRLERRLLSAADALITHTEASRRRLAQRLPGLDPARIHVIPHGVEVRDASLPRAAACAAAGLDATRRYVITFGNLRGYKGVPVLLDAWRQLAPRLVDVDLVIAGRLWGGRGGLSGLVARLLGARKAEARIQALLADPLLAGRVVFREGFFANELIDALCQCAELAVFPHERMAGQSGAVSYAAGFGTPVLVSAVGGLPELAIGPDYIVPPGDVDALAIRLAAQLGVAPDAARAAQRAHVARFAWAVVAVLHARLYRALLA